jgi:hypothetical protein
MGERRHRAAGGVANAVRVRSRLGAEVSGRRSPAAGARGDPPRAGGEAPRWRAG